MVFNNKVYDTLKWIAMYLLPALGTLYFALATVWGLPYAKEIEGTIMAVDTFLGVILGISKACYQGDGSLIVNEDDPENLTLESALSDETLLKSGKTLVLKVERGS